MVALLVEPGDRSCAVCGDARSHPAKLALLHGGERGLGQRDDDVDLVADFSLAILQPRGSSTATERCTARRKSSSG